MHPSSLLPPRAQPHSDFEKRLLIALCGGFDVSLETVRRAMSGPPNSDDCITSIMNESARATVVSVCRFTYQYTQTAETNVDALV